MCQTTAQVNRTERILLSHILHFIIYYIDYITFGNIILIIIITPNPPILLSDYQHCDGFPTTSTILSYSKSKKIYIYLYIYNIFTIL